MKDLLRYILLNDHGTAIPSRPATFTALLFCLAVACLGLVACTDDALDAVADGDDSAATGGLYIRCAVADHESTVYTRASSTEAGWDDGWNENTLSRLDIFIFERGDFIENVTTYTVTTHTVAIKDVTTSGVTSKVTTTTTTTTTWTVTTLADGTQTTSDKITSTSYYYEAAYESGDTEGTTNDTVVTSHDSYKYSFKSYVYVTSADNSTLAVGTPLQLKDSNNEPLKGSLIADTDSIYIVANHDFSEDSSTFSVSSSDGNSNSYTYSQLITNSLLTIDHLKAEEADFSLSEGGQRKKQDSFVMEGRLIGSDVTVVRDPSDYGEETKTIEVSLKRALAKVCLRIKYKGIDDTSYTQISDFSDYGIALKLMHYASTASIVEEGEYFPTEDNYTTTLTNESDYSSELIYYSSPTSSDSEDSTTDSDPRAVFYICPNNWLDASKVSSMNTVEPIIEDMQTHLMMSVAPTHVGSTTYCYYKVPINKLLPDDNDAVVPDASYKELYRVDRNHVYNVTVYVEELYNGFRITLDGTNSTIIKDLTESNTDITITY